MLSSLLLPYPLFLPLLLWQLSGRWFASNTSQNMLRFDYVSTNKPRKGTSTLTKKRFDKMAETLDLESLKRVWDKMCLKAQVISSLIL